MLLRRADVRHWASKRWTTGKWGHLHRELGGIRQCLVPLVTLPCPRLRKSPNKQSSYSIGSHWAQRLVAPSPQIFFCSPAPPSPLLTLHPRHHICLRSCLDLLLNAVALSDKLSVSHRGWRVRLNDTTILSSHTKTKKPINFYFLNSSFPTPHTFH